MEVSTAHVSTRSGPSIVWLIPLITLIVGGWLVYRTLSEKGPEITISFKTAEGIEAGRTMVKYKNVDIGTVEMIRFSDDLANVILTVQFNQGTENFFRRNTRFWVVRPQLSLRGVSGLSTLVSGSYVEIEPGPGAAQSHFVGLEEKPVVSADEVGTRIVLISDTLGSVDSGSPIYYQGIKAGEVLGYELGNDNTSVYIHSFIKDPYDQLLRGNTRFWNVSGMDVSVTTEGIRVKTASLQSLLFGGIAFETPPSLERVGEGIENLVFTLYRDHEIIQETSYTKKLNFVMFFDSTVRGLQIGAPVEFQGIKVGSVLDLRLEFDSQDSTFSIPVLIEIEPERIVDRNTDENEESPYETLNSLVDRGLRARLQSGSLLTGQLFIELSMQPETPLVLSGQESRYPELPTVEAASFANITKAATEFMTKLEKVKIDEIGEELLAALQGANDIINAPEVQASVRDLEASLKSLRSILRKVDNSNLQEAIDAGHGALDKLNETLTLTNRILKPDSPLQYNVIQLTGELEETARAIRSLVEILQRKPESVIFGKDSEGE